MRKIWTTYSRHVLDARDQPVHILDPVALHLLRPVQSTLLNQPDIIPASTLKKISEELDAKWSRRGYLIVLVYVVGLLLCYGGGVYYKYFISVAPNWDFVSILFFVIQLVFMLGAFLLTWWIAKGVRFARVYPAMLKYLHCPSCGYDIRGLSPDPNDKATVCPECGCAWLLNDFGSSGNIDNPLPA